MQNCGVALPRCPRSCSQRYLGRCIPPLAPGLSAARRPTPAFCRCLTTPQLCMLQRIGRLTGGYRYYGYQVLSCRETEGTSTKLSQASLYKTDRVQAAQLKNRSLSSRCLSRGVRRKCGYCYINGSILILVVKGRTLHTLYEHITASLVFRSTNSMDGGCAGSGNLRDSRSIFLCSAFKAANENAKGRPLSILPSHFEAGIFIVCLSRNRFKKFLLDGKDLRFTFKRSNHAVCKQFVALMKPAGKPSHHL